MYRRGKSAKLGGYREAGGKGVHDEADEGVEAVLAFPAGEVGFSLLGVGKDGLRLMA